MAMVSIVKGSMLMLTGGYPITETFVVLDAIGNGYLMGIPVPVVIFAPTVLGAWVVLSKTRFGRYVYSVGGNADASKLNGINVDVQNKKYSSLTRCWQDWRASCWWKDGHGQPCGRRRI